MVILRTPISVLKEILPTIYDPELTFMQDNTHIHIAKKSQELAA
jgi:hypothetical protein